MSTDKLKTWLMVHKEDCRRELEFLDTIEKQVSKVSFPVDKFEDMYNTNPVTGVRTFLGLSISWSAESKRTATMKFERGAYTCHMYQAGLVVLSASGEAVSQHIYTVLESINVYLQDEDAA